MFTFGYSDEMIDATVKITRPLSQLDFCNTDGKLVANYRGRQIETTQTNSNVSVCTPISKANRMLDCFDQFCDEVWQDSNYRPNRKTKFVYLIDRHNMEIATNYWSAIPDFFNPHLPPYNADWDNPIDQIYTLQLSELITIEFWVIAQYASDQQCAALRKTAQMFSRDYSEICHGMNQRQMIHLFMLQYAQYRKHKQELSYKDTLIDDLHKRAQPIKTEDQHKFLQCQLSAQHSSEIVHIAQDNKINAIKRLREIVKLDLLELVNLDLLTAKDIIEMLLRDYADCGNKTEYTERGTKIIRCGSSDDNMWKVYTAHRFPMYPDNDN